MAETPFPNPLTSQFNPTAWNIEGLTEDEEAYLDANFVRFPNPQTGIIFPDAPRAPTLPNGTNTTEVATTGFVQNAITAFKAATNNWSLSQTFTSLIATLSAPLTVSYLPSTIGASNLGHVINVVITNQSIPITFTTVGTISLTQGRWLVMCLINSSGNGSNIQITQNLQDGATVLNTAYDLILNTGNFTSSMNSIIVDNTSTATPVVPVVITSVIKASATGIGTQSISFLRAIRVG